MPTHKQQFNKRYGFTLDNSHSIQELSKLSGIPLKILNEINKSKNWNYDVTDMFPFQYSVYHENDHYYWHVDTGSAYLKQKERKISFSLILNDNYKGGELEFKNSDENISLDLNKGDMVTFPSFLEHRVKPVLNGTRISLVGWMLGPC